VQQTVAHLPAFLISILIIRFYLPVEFVCGHAEKYTYDGVDGDKRWSRQQLILETESVVVPFAER